MPQPTTIQPVQQEVIRQVSPEAPSPTKFISGFIPDTEMYHGQLENGNVLFAAIGSEVVARALEPQ